MTNLSNDYPFDHPQAKATVNSLNKNYAWLTRKKKMQTAKLFVFTLQGDQDEEQEGTVIDTEEVKMKFDDGNNS